MAFYLKYRPQKVSDLDSELIRKQFSRLFSNSSFPHAFLFIGTKGIGKTSTARIVAKIINCQKGAAFQKNWKFIEPCNKCEACISITKGNNLDVLEIDGASNRGIDEIRQLRERISFAPAQSLYKVYIIDEVHMLTTEAFNALLKTLEEPPKHALFILCTTDSHKVPDTIVSRCTTIVFRKATDEELVRSLKRVAKGENITVGDETLRVIASFSEGSFRDATKTLEHIKMTNEGLITASNVHDLLLSSTIDEDELINLILNSKTKEALNIIQNSVDMGVDPKVLNKQMLSLLRNKLISLVSTDNSKSASIADITRLIRLLSKAQGEIKYAPIGQLPIELAIVEYCFERGESKL